MNELQLMLTPTPGAKPEFLAKLRVVNPSPAIVKLWEATSQGQSGAVVLEGYSKDSWAWKPSCNLTNLTVESVDGRKKLPGFTKYLRDRRKCAFGRFGSVGLMVISYVQKSGLGVDRMEARISLDFTKIDGCKLSPRSKPKAPPASKIQERKPKPGGAGLLGKLVGAQQRTNHHVAVASAGRSSASGSSGTSTSSRSGGNTSSKTAQEVLAAFRQKQNDKMLDFDLSSEESIQVVIKISEEQAGLADEDKAKVTMEILKYMVYEAAEEVNEEWIAYKEPGGFMDEANIIVYKEGAAPPEVLEEVNKGEMPEEVLGQQRALAQERQRAATQADVRHKTQLELAAHAQAEEEEAVSTLNTNKRDRRTIEDYEREKRQRAG